MTDHQPHRVPDQVQRIGGESPVPSRPVPSPITYSPIHDLSPFRARPSRPVDNSRPTPFTVMDEALRASSNGGGM